MLIILITLIIKKIDKLLFDEIKVEILISMLSYFFIVFSIFFIKQKIEDIINFQAFLPNSITLIINIILILIIIKFINNFVKNYLYNLRVGSKLGNFIFSRIYTFNGNAINKNDIKIIKKKDKILYYYISTRECRNYCYDISFDLLNCLKEGEIKYLATRLPDEEAKQYNSKYTLHSIYVKHNWCFDTYTRKQYILSDLIDLYEAKEFMSFSYKDIEGKSYTDFSTPIRPLIKDWCTKNDCYQEIA